MNRLNLGRRLFAAMSLSACLLATSGLQGCATVGGAGSAEAARQATQEKLDENLAAADKALKQGQTDQALSHLDAASRVDPSAKQPWLKKAQIHFEARQYGQTITQAQEVIQRDVNDLTARSILAVSGLRVSAQALDHLRKVNEVNGSTRSEAESVARIIHEALGEPILLAPTAAGPVQPTADSAPGRARTGQRAPSRPALRSASSATGAPAAAPPVPAAAAIAPVPSSKSAPVPRPVPAGTGRNNPFGALQ